MGALSLRAWRRGVVAGALVACIFGGAPSCAPTFAERASLVTGTRVLAVRGEPPEVKPSSTMTLDALVVSPEGTLASPAIAWAFCATPNTMGNNDSVSAACLGAGGVTAIPIVAPSVTASIPGGACALFGPDPPPGGYRPADADGTGGYYQPVRVETDGAPITFGDERIMCDLAAAPAPLAAEYAARYVANANPTLLPLLATEGGVPVALDAVKAGARIELQAAWSAADAESYVSFDVPTQTIVERREAMRVSWFVSQGELAADATGRAENDMATTSANTWTAPHVPGPAFLWIVLEDSRGGVDFTTTPIIVTR